MRLAVTDKIVALRNEKGSYNSQTQHMNIVHIVALRNEKGSYNYIDCIRIDGRIAALRNEKGSYNLTNRGVKSSNIGAAKWKRYSFDR